MSDDLIGGILLGDPAACLPVVLARARRVRAHLRALLDRGGLSRAPRYRLLRARETINALHDLLLDADADQSPTLPTDVRALRWLLLVVSDEGHRLLGGAFDPPDGDDCAAALRLRPLAMPYVYGAFELAGGTWAVHACGRAYWEAHRHLPDFGEMDDADRRLRADLPYGGLHENLAGEFLAWRDDPATGWRRPWQSLDELRWELYHRGFSECEDLRQLCLRSARGRPHPDRRPLETPGGTP